MISTYITNNILTKNIKKISIGIVFALLGFSLFIFSATKVNADVPIFTGPAITNDGYCGIGGIGYMSSYCTGIGYDSGGSCGDGVGGASCCVGGAGGSGASGSTGASASASASASDSAASSDSSASDSGDSDGGNE